ncbi:MAG: hypothetical protein ABIS01_07010, partial [Ferruginibacter sp.]
LSPAHEIMTFHEKKFCKKGYINGGIYALNVASFLKEALPGSFSFEKDYLEKYTGLKKFCGTIHQNYFIDIGIPEDYLRFQEDYQLILSKDKNTRDVGSQTTASFLNTFFDTLD